MKRIRNKLGKGFWGCGNGFEIKDKSMDILIGKRREIISTFFQKGPGK